VTGLNDAVRREGVRWHACTACGRDWPFPAGHHEQRDWRCHACLEADVARELRAAAGTAAYAVVAHIEEIHGEYG
jgi:hypothetical protein